MKEKLMPKKRVKMAVSHVEPDRAPITIYLTPEAGAAVQEYLGEQPIIEALEVDFRHVGPGGGPDLRAPEPGSGIKEYDMWGTGWSVVPNNAGGVYLEPTELGLARVATMDEVRAYPWPSPDDYDYSTIPGQIAQNSEYAICVGGWGAPDIINGVSMCRGMEQVLMDIATEDEVGVAIIDARVDFWYEWCKRCLEAGGGKIDILSLGEDLGNQLGPTVSPACFESFFRPRLEKFYKLAHDYGAYAMMHSCGSTRKLQPMLIDMGLDILEAAQPDPVGMDPEGLKADFGDKLTYCGMISVQKTLPYGSVEECRAEARYRLDVIGKGGGYIFAPANCIQADTPVENILAIYEEATGKRLLRG